MAIPKFEDIWLNNADVGGDDSDLAELNMLLDAELEALINDDKLEDEKFKLIADDITTTQKEEGDDFSFAELDLESLMAEQSSEAAATEETPYKAAPVVRRPASRGLVRLAGLLGAVAVVLAVIVAVNHFITDDDVWARSVLSAPPVVFNNANNLFPNETEWFNGENITLNRVSIDASASVFFFDSAVDMGGTDVRLICDRGFEFAPDPAFYPFIDGSVPERTVLRFQPFDRWTEGFTLTLTDIETGSRALFSFALEGDFAINARYLPEPIALVSNIPGVYAVIENFSVNTTGTVLDFSLSSVNPGEMVVFGVEDGSGVNFTMHAPTIVSPVKEPVTAFFEDGNITVGRAHFAPLPNLRGTARVSFRDVALRYEVNRRIPMNVLWERISSDTYLIEAGLYDVYVERVFRQGDYFRLVAHAINNHVLAVGGQDPLRQDFRREQTHINANLEFRLPNGETILLDGEVFTRQAGTDILFDASEYSELIEGLPLSAKAIIINSISFSIGDLSAEIDLNGLAELNHDRDARRGIRTALTDMLQADMLQADQLTVNVTAVSEHNGTYFATAAYIYRDDNGALRRGLIQTALQYRGGEFVVVD